MALSNPEKEDKEMKHKVSKQFLSALLALVMVIGLIPASTLTAFAAEKTVVTEIETRISAEHVPYAGKDYDDLYTLIDSTIYGSLQSTGSDWVDDAGVTIDEKGNGGYDEWYDIRYQFEAGRTYTAVYTYMITPSYEETYKFTEGTTVTLTNPDPSKCTITGEVIEVRDSGRIVDVRYTMTIAGERSYPDIKSATLQKITTPADGVQAETTALMYSNCTLTSQSWNPNTDTFAAGNTYTLTVNLHAKDGYKFADDFAPVLGIEGYEKAADNVELLNSKKDAAVSFTYAVGDYTFIDTLELEPRNDVANFIPIAGESAGYFPDLFEPVDNAPYEKEWLSSRQWYNEDDKTYMEQGDVFEAGKTYSYHSIFRIKTENEGTHRFASPTVQLGDFIYKNDIRTEVGDDPLRIYVTFYYTCKFPEGVGSSAKNPAVCHSYWEFKYAMESNDIRYVALGNVNETMPVGEEGLVTAIHVNGIKSLNLLGDATFTAPASNTTTYAALLHTEQNDTLNIGGAGSLTFKAVANNSYNAVIYNQGGSVNISGGTLIGSYNTAVYGKAIWQSYGELRISGGQFFAENALAPSSLPAPKTAVDLEGGQTWIQGGTFKTENVIDTIDLPYGLEIGKNATVDLSGGTFHGILLPKSSTPLANYMDEDLYTPLSNESKFNPESVYSQEYTASGKVVRIAWLINHVDVHINAPVAGVDIAENYFNIPTSGCQATMYYPQWYKNGEPVTYGTFEAGASYKVVVQIDAKANYGAEFTNDVTAAINNQSVEVDRKSEHWIEVEYDFGECPATISDVELNVTAPKEGNTISYSVTDSSDAYGAVGSGNTITNYRAWYVSDDGSNYTRMSQGDKFVAGKYYKFSTWVRTADGYEFPLYDNGVSIVPNVSATVNGYYANVTKAYDQDPSRVIVVEYDFGMCNDSVIENITVVDVTAPVAGEYPSYTYNILGSGYQMNTSKNAYLYVYWENPPEKWYYIKNGISWWDVTDGGYDYVYENDTFIPGHQYQCKVYLKVEDGFEFAYNNGTPTVTATMNGNTAETTMYGSGLQWEQQVTYTFTCSQAEVSSVEVSGIDAPVAGQTPDYTGTVGNAALYGFANYGYNAAGFWWYDSEDNPLTSEDKFAAGETYKLEIKLTSAMIEQVVASRFKTPVTATLNGKAVDSSDVMANSSTVYIYQTYTCKETSAVFVSGSVTSFNDASGDITLQLIPEGLSEPAYETIVTGNTVDYYFADVAAGTYTLKVSKNNHVTREYTVVVGNSSVIQDVKIYLLGDISGDGVISVQDALLALQAAVGKYTPTAYEQKAGDVNADGTLDVSDALLILQKAVNKIQAFPVEA